MTMKREEAEEYEEYGTGGRMWCTRTEEYGVMGSMLRLGSMGLGT